MEKYLSAVSEMYSQFKKKEALPLEKYAGRHAQVGDQKSEAIWYSKGIVLWGNEGILKASSFGVTGVF